MDDLNLDLDSFLKRMVDAGAPLSESFLKKKKDVPVFGMRQTFDELAKSK